MMKWLTILATTVALVGPATAETITYACRVKDAEPPTHLYATKVDTAKHTLTLRGKVYRNVKRVFVTLEDDCPKYCLGNGVVTLSTATKGGAVLWVTPPVEGAGNEVYVCDTVWDR
jgi:hypothetical protein